MRKAHFTFLVAIALTLPMTLLMPSADAQQTRPQVEQGTRTRPTPSQGARPGGDRGAQSRPSPGRQTDVRPTPSAQRPPHQGARPGGDRSVQSRPAPGRQTDARPTPSAQRPPHQGSRPTRPTPPHVTQPSRPHPPHVSQRPHPPHVVQRPAPVHVVSPILPGPPHVHIGYVPRYPRTIYVAPRVVVRPAPVYVSSIPSYAWREAIAELESGRQWVLSAQHASEDAWTASVAWSFEEAHQLLDRAEYLISRRRSLGEVYQLVSRAVDAADDGLRQADMVRDSWYHERSLLSPAPAPSGYLPSVEPVRGGYFR